VDDHHRAAAGERLVLVAPMHQGDHQRPQIEPLLGEEVLVAFGPLAVGAALEDVLVDQALKPGGEDVSRHPERALHLGELPVPVEDLSNDEKRPALADQLQAPRDRADLSLVFVPKHDCDLRTLGCIMQLTLVVSHP
jgi:hypothetical protein